MDGEKTKNEKVENEKTKNEKVKFNNDNFEIAEMLQGNIERGLYFYKKNEKSQENDIKDKEENKENSKMEKKKISYKSVLAVAGVGIVLFGTKGLIEQKIAEKTNRNSAIRTYVEQLDEMYICESNNMENIESEINETNSENSNENMFSKEDLEDLRRFYAAIDIYINSSDDNLENINNKSLAEAVIINYIKEQKLLNTSTSMVAAKLKDAIIYGEMDNSNIDKNSRISVEYKENVEAKKKYIQIEETGMIFEIDTILSQSIPKNLENLIIDIYELKDIQKSKEKWINQAIHVAEDLAVVADENYVFDKKDKITKISKKDYKKRTSNIYRDESNESKQSLHILDNELER